MAVGIALDLIMRGTVSIASFKVLNGISKLIAFLGRGSNFNVAFVIKPKVPSERSSGLLRNIRNCFLQPFLQIPRSFHLEGQLQDL